MNAGIVTHVMTHADSLRAINLFVDAKNSSASFDYNDGMLFLLGIIGIFLYCLKKIQTIKNNPSIPNVSITEFLKKEYLSISSSLVVVLLALILKKEIIELQYAKHYLGVAFFVFGYAGQNIIYALIGKVGKVAGVNIPTDDKN